MLEKVPTSVGRLLSRVRPGMHKLVVNDPAFATVSGTLAVSSPAFERGQAMPKLYTADGLASSPPLSWDGVPDLAKAFALIIEDADSPTPKPLVHAIVLNIPAVERALPEGALTSQTHGWLLGRNSFLKRAYLPPDPPRGHGVHRYAFQLFACRRPLERAPGAGRNAFIAAVSSQAIAKGCLIGTYERR